MSRAFPVSGLKEVMANLSALGKRIETQAVRSGLTAAAEPILREAKLLTWNNDVEAALTKGSPRRNEDGTFSIRVYVDPNKPGAYLALFEEYGTKPHFISAGDIDNLSPRLLTRKARNEGVSQPISRFRDGSVHKQAGVLLIGDNYVTHGVMHPGARAHPFMRVSLDVRAEDAVQAFRAKVIEVVEKKTGFRLDGGLAEAA